jgi:hypothetical protein
MNKKIEIGFCESDLVELRDGSEMNWNFDGIEVTIFNEWTSDYDIEDIPEASPTHLFIDLTEGDIEDLIRGETFDWTFEGVDCLLFNSSM